MLSKDLRRKYVIHEFIFQIIEFLSVNETETETETFFEIFLVPEITGDNPPQCCPIFLFHKTHIVLTSTRIKNFEKPITHHPETFEIKMASFNSFCSFFAYLPVSIPPF